MKKRAKLKNSAEPLLVRRYLRSSLLSPSKNWFKNIIHRKNVVNYESFELMALVGGIFTFVSSLMLATAIMVGFNTFQKYGSEVVFIALLQDPFFYISTVLTILPIPPAIVGLLGMKGKFEDDERVELKLPEHLSKHLDKVPEEVIHEFYDSIMDFRKLKEILDDIDKALSKGMSRFLRKDLTDKRNEASDEADKAWDNARTAFLKIKSTADEFAEIDKKHKQQDEIIAHDKEVLKMLISLNSESEDDIQYVESSEDIKQQFAK